MNNIQSEVFIKLSAHNMKPKIIEFYPAAEDEMINMLDKDDFISLVSSYDCVIYLVQTENVKQYNYEPLEGVENTFFADNIKGKIVIFKEFIK